MPFRIFHTESRSILSPTTGFIAQAGFTHSLTPARNCTFGCTYCYVPTLRLYGGLERRDWEHWGQFTTFKDNAPALLRKQLRGHQIIYCSPLTDPYQPAEESEARMPAILQELIAQPPRVFTIQTRGPLILRDIHLLRELASRTVLRVSFSITTNREEVRRLYEPLCAPVGERLAAVRRLRDAGIATFVTLAPLLPSDLDQLVEEAIGASGRDLIGDPFHVRAIKASGATTRDGAVRISRHRGFESWHDPDFQAEAVRTIERAAAARGHRFAIGPQGFGWLARGPLP